MSDLVNSPITNPSDDYMVKPHEEDHAHGFSRTHSDENSSLEEVIKHIVRLQSYFDSSVGKSKDNGALSEGLSSIRQENMQLLQQLMQQLGHRMAPSDKRHLDSSAIGIEDLSIDVSSLKPKYSNGNNALNDPNNISAQIAHLKSLLKKTNESLADIQDSIPSLVGKVSEICYHPLENPRLLSKVFSFLPICDVSVCMNVCRRWRSLSLRNDDVLWTTIAENQGGLPSIIRGGYYKSNLLSTSSFSGQINLPPDMLARTLGWIGPYSVEEELAIMNGSSRKGLHTRTIYKIFSALHQSPSDSHTVKKRMGRSGSLSDNCSCSDGVHLDSCAFKGNRRELSNSVEKEDLSELKTCSFPSSNVADNSIRYSSFPEAIPFSPLGSELELEELLKLAQTSLANHFAFYASQATDEDERSWLLSLREVPLISELCELKDVSDIASLPPFHISPLSMVNVAVDVETTEDVPLQRTRGVSLSADSDVSNVVEFPSITPKPPLYRGSSMGSFHVPSSSGIEITHGPSLSRHASMYAEDYLNRLQQPIAPKPPAPGVPIWPNVPNSHRVNAFYVLAGTEAERAALLRTRICHLEEPLRLEREHLSQFAPRKNVHRRYGDGSDISMNGLDSLRSDSTGFSLEDVRSEALIDEQHGDLLSMEAGPDSPEFDGEDELLGQQLRVRALEKAMQLLGHVLARSCARAALAKYLADLEFAASVAESRRRRLRAVARAWTTGGRSDAPLCHALTHILSGRVIPNVHLSVPKPPSVQESPLFCTGSSGDDSVVSTTVSSVAGSLAPSQFSSPRLTAGAAALPLPLLPTQLSSQLQSLSQPSQPQNSHTQLMSMRKIDISPFFPLGRGPERALLHLSTVDFDEAEEGVLGVKHLEVPSLKFDCNCEEYTMSAAYRRYSYLEATRGLGISGPHEVPCSGSDASLSSLAGIDSSALAGSESDAAVRSVSSCVEMYPGSLRREYCYVCAGDRVVCIRCPAGMDCGGNCEDDLESDDISVRARTDSINAPPLLLPPGSLSPAKLGSSGGDSTLPAAHAHAPSLSSVKTTLTDLSTAEDVDVPSRERSGSSSSAASSPASGSLPYPRPGARTLSGLPLTPQQVEAFFRPLDERRLRVPLWTPPTPLGDSIEAYLGQRSLQPPFESSFSLVDADCLRTFGDLVEMLTASTSSASPSGSVSPHLAPSDGTVDASAVPLPRSTSSKSESSSSIPRILLRDAFPTSYILPNVLEDEPLTLDSIRALRRTLRAVMLALEVADPITGYCQGMHFLAAHLISHVSSGPSLLCMLGLLHSRGLKVFQLFTEGLPRARLSFSVLGTLARARAPNVASLLHAVKLPPSVFLPPWLLPLYTAPGGLQAQPRAQFWDALLMRGWSSFWATTLIVLSTLEGPFGEILKGCKGGQLSEEDLSEALAVALQALHAAPASVRGGVGFELAMRASSRGMDRLLRFAFRKYEIQQRKHAQLLLQQQQQDLRSKFSSNNRVLPTSTNPSNSLSQSPLIQAGLPHPSSAPSQLNAAGGPPIHVHPTPAFSTTTGISSNGFGSISILGVGGSSGSGDGNGTRAFRAMTGDTSEVSSDEEDLVSGFSLGESESNDFFGISLGNRARNSSRIGPRTPAGRASRLSNHTVGPHSGFKPFKGVTLGVEKLLKKLKLGDHTQTVTSNANGSGRDISHSHSGRLTREGYPPVHPSSSTSTFPSSSLPTNTPSLSPSIVASSSEGALPSQHTPSLSGVDARAAGDLLGANYSGSSTSTLSIGLNLAPLPSPSSKLAHTEGHSGRLRSSSIGFSFLSGSPLVSGLRGMSMEVSSLAVTEKEKEKEKEVDDRSSTINSPSRSPFTAPSASSTILNTINSMFSSGPAKEREKEREQSIPEDLGRGTAQSSPLPTLFNRGSASPSGDADALRLGQTLAQACNLSDFAAAESGAVTLTTVPVNLISESHGTPSFHLDPFAENSQELSREPYGELPLAPAPVRGTVLSTLSQFDPFSDVPIHLAASEQGDSSPSEEQAGTSAFLRLNRQSAVTEALESQASTNVPPALLEPLLVGNNGSEVSSEPPDSRSPLTPGAPRLSLSAFMAGPKAEAPARQVDSKVDVSGDVPLSLSAADSVSTRNFAASMEEKPLNSVSSSDFDFASFAPSTVTPLSNADGNFPLSPIPVVSSPVGFADALSSALEPAFGNMSPADSGNQWAVLNTTVDAAFEVPPPFSPPVSNFPTPSVSTETVTASLDSIMNPVAQLDTVFSPES